MIKLRYAAPAVVLAALSLGVVAASAAPGGIGTHGSSLGTVLTDSSGMTLYTFDKDKNGASDCYGGCAAAWPPLLAAAGAKASDGFGLSKRKGGAMQWTYHNMPLYLWSGDKKPGDTTGNGFRGVWHAALAK